MKQLTAFGLLAPASGPAPTMSYSRNPEVLIFPVCTSVPLVFSKPGLVRRGLDRWRGSNRNVLRRRLGSGMAGFGPRWPQVAGSGSGSGSGRGGFTRMGFLRFKESGQWASVWEPGFFSHGLTRVTKLVSNAWRKIKKNSMIFDVIDLFISN